MSKQIKPLSDKELIEKARIKGALQFAKSCETTIRTNGELNEVQRTALNKCINYRRSPVLADKYDKALEHDTYNLTYRDAVAVDMEEL